MPEPRLSRDPAHQLSGTPLVKQAMCLLKYPPE